MNTQPIDAIAKAVLYEGYMLYPYRPSSVKNRQRFNFGVLYPRSYSEAQTGSDAWSLQTECLVEGDSLSTVEVRVRFLKLVSRSVRPLTPAQPTEAAKAGAPWQEAVECEVNLPVYKLQELVEAPRERKFSFPAKEEVEELRNGNGSIGGMIARNQEAILGVFELKAHVVFGVTDGQFISLLEPPENLREVAESCQNVGVWPVLVRAEGARDTMLASPIILYDYPQIAPESPGDLFDGTEIDEILALRILTMTEEEKEEMRNTDERARKMLERTENLPMEQLAKLHGTLRELRPALSSFDSSREEMP